MTSYVLLVAGGSARVTVGATPIRIGRASTSDLVVRDPSVSRQHLRARATEGGIELEVVEGAAPVLHRGQPVVRALVGAGDHVIVGSTILGVDLADHAPQLLRSELETQRGVEADVRGLSAVVGLLDELETAADRDAIAAAADRWARATLDATGAKLVADATLGVTPDVVGCTLAVPAGAQRLAIDLPCEPDRMARGIAAVAGAVIAAALQAAALRAQSVELRALAIGSARAFLGTSRAAADVDALVAKLAASDATALILGESGTGKTFVARLIHEASARANGALRVLNCAAIPEALLEAELFGAERGAFTGATATRIGAFEAVGDGTLLLDEIGELSPGGQAKLLRALEERRFERVGSNRSIELRARLLCATNRDLRAMSETGAFRKDLFFRISVVTLSLPPLRERGEDIVLLAQHMLADLAATCARRVTGFSDDARAALVAYAWPGNARELRNAIEHALVLGETSQIELADLPELVRSARRPRPEGTPTTSVELPADLRWLEERAIEAALAATGGNRTKAAAILGINRVTLQKKLAK